MISEKYKDPSRCERCGREFICGATLSGCWCMKLKLTERARQELKAAYKDCLCPDCLKEYAVPEN